MLKSVECVDTIVAEYQNKVLDYASYTRTTSTCSNQLIFLRSYGSLIAPSTSVVKVLHVTDKILRQKLHQEHFSQKKSLQALKQQVLLQTKPSTFITLQQHSQNCHILGHNLRDNPITTLIHGISDSYVKLLVHRFGKIYSEKVVHDEKPSKRPNLNKLILIGND